MAKNKSLVIKEWKHADRIITRMRDYDNSIESFEAEMNEETARIEKPYQRKLKALTKRYTVLEAALEKFTRTHKGDFKDVKTRKLFAGETSLKEGKDAVNYASENTCVGLIKKDGNYSDWLNTTTKVDKAAVIKAYRESNDKKAFGEILRRFKLIIRKPLNFKVKFYKVEIEEN